MVESGDNGAWNQLERGEITISEFAEKFSNEVSERVKTFLLLSQLIRFQGESDMTSFISYIRFLYKMYMHALHISSINK